MTIEEWIEEEEEENTDEENENENAPEEVRDFDQLIIEALGKFNVNDFEEAKKLLDEAILINPNHYGAWKNRGNSNVKLGNYQDAIESYNQSLKLNPLDPGTFTNLGNTKSSLGRYEEAIKDYDKAIKINPNYSSAWTNRGTALAQLGETQESLQSLNKAVDIDPENYITFFNRGNTKVILGLYEEAIKDFDEAIRLNPLDSASINNRAATQAQLNANKVFEERLGSLADTEELDKQSNYYKKLHAKLLKDISKKTWFLAVMLWILIIVLIFFLITNYDLKSLSPLAIFPWIIMIIMLVTPIVWSLRFSIKQADKAEMMEQEYLHLSYVEKRILFYFGKDDDDLSKQIKYDYINATLTNSPADKLLNINKKSGERLSILPASNIVNKDT